ncbi:FecR family protein [Alsobacter soli]|uniref:FecR family protein n=1 Tax=Alsobacter soli TaxID=2109933 RepID=UPI0013050685|nr:FecR domain-containing protein [Alsobacter soli]
MAHVQATAVTSALPGQAPAPVQNNDKVVSEATIETDARGQVDIRFLDETRLTLGPSSRAKLDRFVYAPRGGFLDFAVDASRGVFSFVTGRSSHEAYRLRTPVATIGVRGTAFVFRVRDGQLSMDVSQGRVLVCPNRRGDWKCQSVPAGRGVRVTPKGARLGGLNNLALPIGRIRTPALPGTGPFLSPLRNGLPAGSLTPGLAPVAPTSPLEPAPLEQRLPSIQPPVRLPSGGLLR